MNARPRTASDFRPKFDDLDGRILLSASMLTPAQIRQAYTENFDFVVNGQRYAADGSGQTIAIVIGGLDPYIANDLATFDSAFMLPAPPSFQSVYFQGAQNNESADWIEETSLDVEWSHAIAPGANILLVQAASMSLPDLMAAVNWARLQPGVSVVSMSWSSPESSAHTQYDGIFTTPAEHTGVTFVASTGDYGYFNSPAQNQVGVVWPAACPNVVAVGGTSLLLNADGSYAGEAAWSGGGGGFSQVYPEPTYQQGAQNTGVRTIPDVSYDGDRNTGFAIYDTYDWGWEDVGGTSAGTPQWAALIAIADQGRALAGLLPLDGPSQTLPALYQFSSDFNDVTQGSNGYSAGPGYDVATGLGTPIAMNLVGDLAFNVTSNYNAMAANAMATNAMRSPLSHATTGSTPSPSAMTPFLQEAGRSAHARPEVRGLVSSHVTDPATQESILIALPPTDSTSPVATIGHRHDRHDLALGSLVDGDLEFLRL
jgi:subtilase family serine protease